MARSRFIDGRIALRQYDTRSAALHGYPAHEVIQACNRFNLPLDCGGRQGARLWTDEKDLR